MIIINKINNSYYLLNIKIHCFIRYNCTSLTFFPLSIILIMNGYLYI